MDILQAVHRVEEILSEIKSEIICNCWRKIGLVEKVSTNNENEIENDNEDREYEEC